MKVALKVKVQACIVYSAKRSRAKGILNWQLKNWVVFQKVC